MRRSGFSSLEALTSLAISVLVIGGAAALYAFAMRRVVQDSMKAGVLSHAQIAVSDMTRTIESAAHCDTFPIAGSASPFNGSAALRCAMPENFVDTGGTTAPDSYLASKVSARGFEISIPSRWIWYIWAPAGPSGSYRLIRTTTNSPQESSLSPSSATAWDPSFTFAGAGRFRLDKLTSVSWKIDTEAKAVRMTVRAQSVGRSPGAAVTAGDAMSANDETLTRAVPWTNGLDPREKGDGTTLISNSFWAEGTTTGWTGASGLRRQFYGGSINTPFYHIQSNGGDTVGSLDMSPSSVTVEAGSTYVLSFSMGMVSLSLATSDDVGRFMRLRVTVTSNTGACLGQWDLTDGTSGAVWPRCFSEHSLPFRATGATSVTVRFQDLTTLSNSTSCDLVLGRIQLKKVND